MSVMLNFYRSWKQKGRETASRKRSMNRSLQYFSQVNSVKGILCSVMTSSCT